MPKDERDRTDIQAALRAGTDIVVSLTLDPRIVRLLDETADEHTGGKRSPMAEWILATRLLPEGEANEIRDRRKRK